MTDKHNIRKGFMERRTNSLSPNEPTYTGVIVNNSIRPNDEAEFGEHNRQMKSARKIMTKYNSALRDLAKL